MKKEIITIAGAPGSGKSSTADLVAKELNFTRFSSGNFMRQIALKRGVSLGELSRQAEKDNSIDLEIDKEVRKIAEMKKIVVDSRLAFHWIPRSFKVYLDLTPEKAAERILKDLKVNKLRKETEDSSGYTEIYKKITARLESEKKRYKELYSIDYMDKKKFDLIVDTEKNNLKQVVEMIVSEYKKWLKEN
jgi:cytidylate kinase